MGKSFISIIITNFNGEIFLTRCLKSVLKSIFKNFELLIVDDGSTDNSLDILKKFQKQDSRITIIRNTKNLGAAASRNRAIKRAKGLVIVFLDNDTEVTSSWLDELNKSLIPKEVGATQALLIDFDKRDTVQMAGGKLIPYAAWLIPFHQGEKYKKIRGKLTDKAIVAVSAALAIKREVLNVIKKFDGKEANYTEDLDFSWRIWIAGYSITLSSNAIVYHYTKSMYHRAFMRSNHFQIYYHLSKNSLRSIIKNYELKNMLVNSSIFIILSLGRGFLVLIRRLDFSALLGAIYGIIWNVTNIKDTLRSRKMVQKTRMVNDSYLFNQIFTDNNIFELYNRYFKKTKLLW